MKSFGWIVLLIGVIWMIFALNMDVSVATGFGERVNNIGLMASRQNHTFIGAFITLCGLLVIIFGKRKTEEAGARTKCPFCAELINSEAIKCRHCGSDVAEALSSLRKEAFRPTDMEFDEFFIRRNDGFEINKESISSLAEKMKNAKKGTHPMNVYDAYKTDIEELKNMLPSSIRDSFEKEVRKHF